MAAIELLQPNYPVTVEWGTANAIYLSGDATQQPAPFSGTNDILRTIARHAIKLQLYGSTELDATWVDHWLSFALGFSVDLAANFQYLDKILAPLTFLVGHRLTIADLALFDIVQQFASVPEMPQKNVKRWAENVLVETAVQQAIIKNKTSVIIKPRPAKAPKTAKTAAATAAPKSGGERKQEGKFIDLPGAEMGKVVVRFPPEASGYLHIGHAKAALLNQYYQQAFEGTLIMRFDDTNPAKETIEFENVILEDLKMLEIKPDLFTHTSQYFDVMLGYCETLLTEGKAYVDDTEAEQMKLDREQKIESVNRSNGECDAALVLFRCVVINGVHAPWL